MKFIKKILMIMFLALILGNCGQQDYDRILEVGITGKGTINKVEDTNVTINDDPQVRLYITVYSKNKEPFDAEIKMVVSRVSIPRAGDWLAVKFDPEDNQKVVWVEDKDYTSEIEREINQIVF